MNEMIDELREIISHWKHNRDRGIYIYRDKDGKEREQELYNSGCVGCNRCEIEKWLAHWGVDLK